MVNGDKIKLNFLSELKKVQKINDIFDLKSKYLGKKGILTTELFANIRTASIEEKKNIGMLSNSLKQFINLECTKKREEIVAKLDQEKLKANAENLSINLLSNQNKLFPIIGNLKKGAVHPLNIIINRFIDFFQQYNFRIYDFTEIDNEKFNFEYLNIPENHVARNTGDTFYLNDKNILRTHTTNLTAYYLQKIYKKGDDAKVISFGNVYRRDTHDSTHTHQFLQLDGFALGNYSLANLKMILTELLTYIFENPVSLLFRPSFFPFTCPSLEVDIKCFKCKEKGCSICKGTGWIEVLGAGIIHPNVLKLAKINDKNISGIAFGIGIERIAMIKYGITDIRSFYDNDLRFLSQFTRVK